MRRSLVFALFAASACRGDPNPPVHSEPKTPVHSATPPTATTADALPPIRRTFVCPEPWWHGDDIMRAVVWPDCPIEPPFSTFAAACLAAPGCMRPCRMELGPVGKIQSTTRYTYDGAGHLLEERENDAKPPHTCRYDAAGRPQVCSDRVVRRDYAYRGNRLVRVARTWLETRDVDVEEFEYDDRGRLKRAMIREKGEPPEEERYEYNAAGLLARIAAAQHPQRFSYNAFGRVVKVAGVMPQDLAYDDAGRVRSIRDYVTSPAGDWAFHYDTSGRLVEETRADGWRIAYGYDCDVP